MKQEIETGNHYSKWKTYCCNIQMKYFLFSSTGFCYFFFCIPDQGMYQEVENSSNHTRLKMKCYNIQMKYLFSPVLRLVLVSYVF